MPLPWRNCISCYFTALTRRVLLIWFACHACFRKPTSNNVLQSSQYRNRTKSGQPLTRKFVNSWGESSVQPEKCDAGKMFLNSFEAKSNSGGGSSKRAHHQRSHSYDLPNNRYAANEETKTTTKKKHPTSHELKHRYREFEQARAKEQVVRWLEQEFSCPAKYCNNRKKNNSVNNSKTTSKEEVKSKIRSYPNEKHEHHHIHEHVHHHYHHYHEAPIVVWIPFVDPVCWWMKCRVWYHRGYLVCKKYIQKEFTSLVFTSWNVST